jgi:ferrochelatase
MNEAMDKIAPGSPGIVRVEKSAYDALLLVSFGGPEGPDDVLPFLENVLRGKPVPRERMLEVAEHYYHFGGVSPLNGQNRQLIAALESELAARGPRLPIYWGNRNWPPLLAEALGQMQRDGVRRALAIFTSAFSSYSSCRQYRENIAAAQQAVGADAPAIDKLRAFYNHPEFIAAWSERVADAFAQVPEERRAATELLYTAHSIPQAMADNCRYVAQLKEAGALVAARVGTANWRLVYQSRSGSPSIPWLEPDICDALVDCQARGVSDVVVAPLGFLSDHMEVLYDLDTEARERASELALNMIRARTIYDHPRFIGMLRDLIVERVEARADRPAIGIYGASHDVCPADCCLPGSRAPRA